MVNLPFETDDETLISKRVDHCVVLNMKQLEFCDYLVDIVWSKVAECIGAH